MIKSMTAYARTEMAEDGITVAVEIRTYNSRNLDMMIHMPHEYHCLEEDVRNVISSRIDRGRVTVHLDIQKNQDNEPVYEIDAPRARAYYNALSRLRDTLELNREVPLELVLNGGDIIKPAKAETDMAVYGGMVQSCMKTALDQLDIMRMKEGDFLAGDFKERLDCLEKCIDRIETASTGLIAHYQEQLKERILRLTQGGIALDDDRIVQEAAFLADKSDISEEIVRVRSHILQFKEFIENEAAPGRKLNFLLQEFNREFNTIGSKTGNASVSYDVVEAKSEIEKIREQVQNVE